MKELKTKHHHSDQEDASGKWILLAAAVAGFFGVVFGAFGAHGLQTLLEQRGTTAAWQTGVQYWFYHSLALLAISFASSLGRDIRRRVSVAWLLGMLIFSGSLFVLATTGPRWLGAVTPIGGILLLVGWLLLFLEILRQSHPPKR